jgi:iron complex outermembrane receptor protein
MKKFIFTIATSISLLGSELDNLLDNYAIENDLSNDTKIEKTGSTQLIVYSRADLDNLQYQTLRDVLTMQRFYTYRENRFGQTDLIDGEPYSISKAGQIVKIYIDNHELTTLQYDSMIQLLGNIELDFVDNIQIYQGPPSFDISSQAAVVVIKLYSKDPSRDNANRIGTSIDNHKSSNAFFHTANAKDKLKYFLYTSTTDFQSEKIKNGTTDLSRDEKRNHLFSTFAYDEDNFLLQYLTKEKDGFLTNSFDGTPIKDDMKDSLLHLGYKRAYLDDKSLEFKTNFTRTKSKGDFLDDMPYLTSQHTSQTASTNQLIALNNPLAVVGNQMVMNSGGFITADTPLTFTNTGIYGEKYQSTDDVLTASITKKYDLDDHQLTFGLSFRDKKLNYDTNEYITSAGNVSMFGTPLLSYANTYNSLAKSNYLTNQTIYSVYGQDAYKLNENHTISFGIKAEKEKNNYYADENLYTIRLSHTYEKNNLMMMTYYTYMEANKNSFYFNTVNDLENEKMDIYGHETKYWGDNFDISYNILHLTIPNLIAADPVTFKNYNMNEDYFLLLNSIMFNYKFNENNSLMFEPWYQYAKAEQLNDFESYSSGLNTRLVNKFSDYTLYNELVLLKNNEKYLPDEYELQYNAGVTYKYDKDLTLYLRGVNMFDGRTGFSYYNYKNKTQNINPIEESYHIGLEYTF